MTSITCPRCGVTSQDQDNIIRMYCDNCEDFHAELPKGVPPWVKKCRERRVWTEDDARPVDAETLRQAWQRLFGEAYPERSAVLTSYDGGDAEYFLYPGWRVACESYPGNSEIYQLRKDDTFVQPVPVENADTSALDI